MRTLLFVCAFLFFAPIIRGQYLLEEDFNYSGTIGGTNGWISYSGISNFMQTTTPGLIFSNYPGSGIGNAASINGISGEDVYKKIPERTQLYYSFLIKVVASNTTKRTDYVSALGKEQNSGVNGTLNGNYFARIIIQTLGDGTWKIGTSNWAVSNTTNPPVYSDKVFNNDHTYAVVVSFNMSDNYKVQIWVFENDFTFDKNNTGAPDVVFTKAPATAALPKSVDAVTLRQSTSAPNVVMDGLRISEYGDARIVPLKMVAFNGTADKLGNIHLKWTVAQAVNVRHFVVERSADGKKFDTHSIVACVNQPTEKTYLLTDYNIRNAKVYYRLKIVDMDGNFEYSNVVHCITASDKLKIEIIGGKTVRVLVPDIQRNSILKILDLNGIVRKVVPLFKTETSKQITLSGLSEGIYLASVENESSRISEKFFLQ